MTIEAIYLPKQNSLIRVACEKCSIVCNCDLRNGMIFLATQLAFFA